MKKINLLYLLLVAVLAGCKEEKIEVIPTGEALYSFALKSPSNNTNLVLNSATPDSTVVLEWGASVTGLRSPVTYAWLAAPKGGNLESPLLEIPSDNNGTATKLTLTQKQLDDALKAKGIAEGAKTNLIWTVRSDNQNQKAKPTQSYNISVTRFGNGVSSFILYGPKSSLTPIELNEDKSSETINIVWQPALSGKAGVPVTYQWLAVKAGENFNSPLLSIPSNNNGTEAKLTFTQKQLDDALATLGIGKGQKVELNWTVVATAGDFSKMSDYTNDIALIRFADIIAYPSLYLPGGYQSWNPATAPRISSVKDDKNYEGYVYFQEATKFKITSNPDWDHTNYGDGGLGKLSTSGGDLSVDAAGYYRVNANLNDLTWTLDKTAWGIIGDATGSWNDDKDLTYDPATKVWKITLALSVGEVKFRANDEWIINYGDTKPANGRLDFNSDNIAITEAGQYEVVLNLSIPGNYSYSLTKK